MKALKAYFAILAFLSSAVAYSGGYSNFPAYGDQHWKAPVASAAALPSSGNFSGDARYTLDNFTVYVWNGSAWQNNAGTTGPGSSTDKALARWNGTTGTALSNSTATLSDVGLLTVADVIHSNATASTVPYFDASKKLISSAVTPTQLGYLDATSSIQTQLNGKQATGSYITALTGDVTASGPGSSAASVVSIANSSAANVHAAEILANAATNLNTTGTIVKRDGSGNFSAGTITAALTGNVTGNVTGAVTGNASTATALAADPAACSSNQWATDIAANGTLTCAQPAFSNLSGSAAAAQMPAFTGGDVTSSAGSVSLAIGASKVTNAMLAGSIDLTAKVTGVLPRASGGTGVTGAWNAQSSSYTLLTSDSSVGVTTGASALTMTLPTAVGVSGQRYTITKVDTGAGTVAINTTSSQTVGGVASGVHKLHFQNDSIVVLSDGSNWQVLVGEPVSFSANNSTTVASTSTPLIYSNIDHNTHASYSAVTGKFTAPFPGKYSFTAIYYFGATTTYATLNKNGTAVAQGMGATGGASTGIATTTISMTTGDTMEVRPGAAATAPSGVVYNVFSGFRVGN